MSNGPIFLWELIYQGKTEPVFTPVAAPVNIGWFARWLDPPQIRAWQLDQEPVWSHAAATFIPGVQFEAQTVQTLNVTNNNSANSFSDTSLTIGTQANRALVVAIGLNSNPGSALALTWDGVPLTQLALIDASDVSSETAIFGLLNPASGNKVLAGSWLNALSFSVAGISFYNVEQSSLANAFKNATTAEGASSPATITVTSAVGDWVVAAESASFTALTPNKNRIYNVRTVSGFGASANRAEGAPSVTLSATESANQIWTAAGLTIKPPAEIAWLKPFSDPVRFRLAQQQSFFAAPQFPIAAVVTPYAGWDDTLEWPRPAQPRTPAYSAPFLAQSFGVFQGRDSLGWFAPLVAPGRAKPIPIPNWPYPQPVPATGGGIVLVDPSSPARVFGTSSATSASFTPPAGSLLVVVTAANADNTLAQSFRVTDTNGLGWSLQSISDGQIFPPLGADGVSTIHTATMGSSAPTTVTVTWTQGVSVDPHMSFKLYVITGQATYPTAIGITGAGAMTGSPATIPVFTSKATNSLVIFGTADASATQIDPTSADLTYDSLGTLFFDVLSGYKQLGAIGPKTVQVTFGGPTPFDSWVAIEIIPAPAGPAPTLGYLQWPDFAPAAKRIAQQQNWSYGTFITPVSTPTWTQWTPWPDFATKPKPAASFTPWTFIPTPAQVFFPAAPWADFARRKQPPLDTQPSAFVATVVQAAQQVWYPADRWPDWFPAKRIAIDPLSETFVGLVPDANVIGDWPDFVRRKSPPIDTRPLIWAPQTIAVQQVWFPYDPWPSFIQKKSVPLNFTPATPFIQTPAQVWFPYGPWDDFARRQQPAIDTQRFAWSNFTPAPTFFFVPNNWPDFAPKTRLLVDLRPWSFIPSPAQVFFFPYAPWDDFARRKPSPLIYPPSVLVPIHVPPLGYLQWPDFATTKRPSLNYIPLTFVQTIRTPWNEMSRWPEMVPIRSKAGLHAALQQFSARFPGTISQATITGILNAFEVNSDVASITILVRQSGPAVRAAVSIQEIGTI